MLGSCLKGKKRAHIQQGEEDMGQKKIGDRGGVKGGKGDKLGGLSP